MIIRGGARAAPARLAAHLMRTDENERVVVEEVRSVCGRTVTEVLREMQAQAAGTRATRPLYHASINVRAGDPMNPAQWRQAIDALETRLGLAGQPRIVVHHIKEGREHVHVVWSRIDQERVRTIGDSHNYRRHEEVARALEREFGHERVQGAHVERDGVERPDRTPDLDSLQQARRTGISVEQVAAELTAAWAKADNGRAFRAAIEAQGYVLARGDRRDYVVIDPGGGVHSVARRIDDARAADVRARFADLDGVAVPTVAQAQEFQRQHAVARAELISAKPAAAIEPEQLLDHLLNSRSYVTGADLYRAAERLPGVTGAEAIRIAVDRALARSDLLALRDGEDGKTIGYTLAAIRAEEERVLATAQRLAERRHAVPDSSRIAEIAAARGLDSEQQAALRHALGAEGLAIITGRAGTGKTSTLTVLHEIATAEGRRVIGLAPTNTLAQDLGQAGFLEARTAHSLLWYIQHAPDHPVARLDGRTVIAIDEAAMLDTRALGSVLDAAERAGAKVVLIGDDRQLASVERGGLFADLRDQLGAAELVNVRRQHENWARESARDFAEGRFREGLAAYAAHERIHFAQDLATARAELVEAWRRDTAAERGNRFAFAYTNDEARQLNRAIQQVEIDHGRVRELREVRTDRGRLQLGVGDRIVLHGTDKAKGLFNGSFGTVDRIEALADGRAIIAARTDQGRVLEIDTRQFDKFGLGYAGTIYKGQGKTLDQAYLLHTRHWRDASSYVALTRSRGATELFVAETGAATVDALARQMERQQNRGSTLRFRADRVREHATGRKRQAEGRDAMTTAEQERAALQRAEREQLRRVQAHRAEREETARQERFASERARLTASLEARHNRQDAQIAATRERADRKRQKHGVLSTALDALAPARKRRRDERDARLHAERQRQDRRNVAARQHEIAKALHRLEEAQRLRAVQERAAGELRFEVERAALAQRRREIAPDRQLDERQERERERDGRER